jgi:hypothetical protein
MTKLLETAIERVRQWPDERQTEIAEMLLALDADDGVDDDPELDAALDAAVAQAERGEFADPKDVEAFFAQHRK